MERKRVAITGMGAISALGFNLEDTWSSIKDGVSTASQLERFDLSTFPSGIASQVDSQYQQKFALALNAIPSTRREVQFGYLAAMEALQKAELSKAPEAIVFGSGMSTDDFTWTMQAATEDPARVAKKYSSHPAELSSLLSASFATTAITRSIHTACASSAQAIGEAYDLVASGTCQVVLTGGADSMVEPLQFAGLSMLGALSSSQGEPWTRYKPFDASRDGFVLGEGAAALVLEDYEHAMARGAIIYAEILGYGITQSAYRITDLKSDGTGPRQSIQAAAFDARIELSSIDYINAHGTGTKANDLIESNLFMELCPQAYVSSTKTMTGHMIAAAGAMEAVITVLSLHNQVLPPSLNVSEQDPECLAKLTPSKATPSALDVALSNSIGFGGTNVSLIFKRGTHAS